MLFMIIVTLSLLLGFSLIFIIYNGSKYTVSDPDNVESLIRNIRIGGVLFFISLILLIFIWIAS